MTLPVWLQMMTVAAGLLVLMAAALMIIAHVLVDLSHLIAERGMKKRNTPPLLWRMPQDVSQLGRWCSWYFPITGDIETFLLKNASGEGWMDIEAFREELFRKYGKRAVGSNAPDPQSPASEVAQ